MNEARENPRDHERLLALLRGDAREVREIESLARSVVRRRAFGIGAEVEEDLVQETLAQIWAACTAPDFELRTALDAFVRTVATARCIDHFRRRRWQEELDDSLVAEVEDPLEEIHRQRLVDALTAAIARLKPLCRDLIRWHFHEGERYESIAEREGRNASTLRVHMFQCLRHLRASLGAGVDRA